MGIMLRVRALPAGFIAPASADSHSPFRGAYIFRPCPHLDARTYMLAVPKRRETAAQWQRAAELLLAQADVAEVTRAVDLALFYDAKVDVSKVLEA